MDYLDGIVNADDWFLLADTHILTHAGPMICSKFHFMPGSQKEKVDHDLSSMEGEECQNIGCLNVKS